MIVLKFGGSSVKDASRVRHVIGLIAERVAEKPILVFSAMGNTTDNLLEAGRQALHNDPGLDTFVSGRLVEFHLQNAQDLGVDPTPLLPLLDELKSLLKGISLLRELSPKTKDYLMSFGERLAVRILAPALSNAGIAAQYFDAWDIGFRTDTTFNEAEVLDETYENIANTLLPVLSHNKITPVITGFIAHSLAGDITTLGRGGTDLTASTVGAALGVREIEVWKDVDGILTTDPRIVSAARPVPLVSFEEASELAYFGAKVLHPLSIQPAMRKNIPVRVKNSYNPSHPGSLIVEKSDKDPDLLVKAITCKRNVTLVDIVSTRCLGQHGFLAKIFQLFADHAISVDMVATSEVSVSLTLNNGAEIGGVVKALSEFATVNVSKHKAILSLIGNIDRSSEILDTAFATLRQEGVNVQMISHGASKVNIGLIVEESEIESCVKAMHKFFFEDSPVESTVNSLSFSELSYPV
jgi:aspartate kinase